MEIAFAIVNTKTLLLNETRFDLTKVVTITNITADENKTNENNIRIWANNSTLFKKVFSITSYPFLIKYSFGEFY